MNRRRKLPYWLSGTEICEVCSGSYVVQMECRCAACDAGLCVSCAIRIYETGENFCPGCREEASD